MYIYSELGHLQDNMYLFYYNNNNNNNNNKQYIKRHDKVCAQLQFNICKEIDIRQWTLVWSCTIIIQVETIREGKATMLGNQVVQTDRIIPNNKLDIITCENEEGTWMLIDAAVSGERIVIKKDAEKILKYKDRTTENQCTWNVKAKWYQ